MALNESNLTNVTLLNLSSVQLFQNDTSPDYTDKLDQSLVWTYGFLIITTINLCSLVGIGLIFLSKRPWYESLLSLMVANATGVLAGSSFLCLLPEALGLEGEQHHTYNLTITIVLGSLLCFYNFEQLLKIVLDAISVKNDDDECQTIKTTSTQIIAPSLDDVSIFTTSASGTATENNITAKYSSVVLNTKTEMNSWLTRQFAAYFGNVKPVAWMIIFGDGIHNFVDGLSIGAGMSKSLHDGFMISIAVLAEEIPHEIGDFAVLLQAGLPARRALLLNFLSACSCYVGFVVGVLVGETPSANRLIFSLAAGLFLYISLTDLLPEIGFRQQKSTSAFGEPTSAKCCKFWPSLRRLTLANFGMIFGYSFIIILAIHFGDPVG